MVTKSIWTKAVTVLSVSLLSLAQTLPVLALEETSSLGSGAPANSTTASSFSSDAVLPVTSSSVLEETSTEEEVNSSEVLTEPATTLQEEEETRQKNALVQIVDYHIDKPNFAVKLVGQADSQGITSIRIAVWSEENGQDDLKWYQPKASQNQAMETIHIVNHANQSGLYVVHAYVT